MTFRKHSCQVTPLCKNLKVLTQNDISRLELAKFMQKLHHGVLPKIYDNVFQYISNVHSNKTRFAENLKLFCTKSLYKFWKKGISFGGAAVRKEIEQCLETVPLSLSSNIIRIVSYIINRFVFTQPYVAIIFFMVTSVVSNSVIVFFLFVNCVLCKMFFFCFATLIIRLWIVALCFVGAPPLDNFKFFLCPGCEYILVVFAFGLLGGIGINKLVYIKYK